MSDMVGNPKNRLSRDAAQIIFDLTNITSDIGLSNKAARWYGGYHVGPNSW